MSLCRRTVRRICLLVAALGCVPSEPVSRSLPTATDSLIALGERVYFAGKYDSALAVWTGALGQSRAQRDSVREARALTWLGIRAWKVGDYREARRLGEQALAMKRRWALQNDLFKSYNALGLVAWQEGRLGDAAELFGEAAAAAQAAGDRTNQGVVAGNLGLIQFDLGEFAEARRGFDSMRVAGRAAGEARVEANALSNLGMLDVRVGDPRGAVARIQEALRLYRSYGDAGGEQLALAQLATAWDALGEPGLALAAIDTAIVLARRAGLQQDEAENVETLAALHREAGDYRRALELYAETAGLKRRLGLAVEAAADDRSEAEIHLALGATTRAAELALSALATHRNADARAEELDDLLLLAEIHATARDRRGADSVVAVAQALAQRFGTRRGRAEAALAAARISERLGDAPTTLTVLARASDEIAAGGYGIEQEAFRLEMRALARQGQLDSAEAAGRRAIAALERVRGSYASAELRTSYLVDHRVAYEELGHILRRMRRPHDALTVADAARGRAFLEHVAAPRQAPLRDGFARRLAQQDTLLRRIDILAEQVDSAERQVAGGESAGQAAAFLRQRLELARRAYEGQLARTGVTLSPGAAAAGSGPLSVPALLRALAPDEALLAYQVGADSLVTFVVSQGHVNAFVQAVSAGRLATRIRIARDLVMRSRTAGVDGGDALEALNEMLIGPARRAGALDGVRRLIVVPDGDLTYLPFAALRDSVAKRWLAESYAITTLPSAAALIALRARKDDPVSSTDRASVFAPRTQALPATQVEANEVGETLQDAVVLRDRRATESAVERALARDAVVHLATHAELNPHNPMFSRIELASGSGNHEAADGQLDLHEIMAFRIRSRLVFLSGCETALGTGAMGGFVAGEDYATLARAFHYAGAREVVATLWRVEDRGAAEFASRFYRHYPGVGAAEALKRAQRAMMANRRYQSPYYWAGYMLSGPGDRAASQSLKPVSVW
jgi:CHAT domain-containing protein/tetratricopeptide (TPR) repeat protein